MRESFITSRKIPLVIEPTGGISFDEFLKYVDENRDELRAKILKHTGVLFRGFPIEGADGFNRVIEVLGLGEQLNYIGGDSPRDKVKGQVYTSTEAPPSLKIPLHNEMSFVKHYPRHIYFYSDIPASSGGATILGDAREIYEKVRPDVRKAFEEKGVRYVSNYYRHDILLDIINKFQRAHKRWMEVFETDEKAVVEQRCKESEFAYQWRKDWLEVVQEAKGVLDHVETGERVWFNQAHLYDYNPRLVGFWNYLGVKLVYARPHTVMHEVCYGDGSRIPRKDLYHVMDVMDQCTIDYPWQKNDMLILDNVLAMHGRAPFKGKRKTLTALTK
ncbi:MAG: TauD/TfdA family dioxygenase [Chlamydiales bacterium]|nr:TauD/TfdA family dioxygenase [Chlamydiales bacterium]